MPVSLRTVAAVALAALAVAPACAPVEPGPPSAGTVSQPIYNGQRAPRVVPLTPGQMAAIGYLHDAGAAQSAFCTGTAIAPRLVVTAKHCTSGRAPAEIAFGIGEQPQDATADFSIDRIEEHPDRDIAVLVLNQATTIEVPGLAPLPFNRRPLTAADTGRDVEAAGFGETLDPSLIGRFFAVVAFSAVDDNYAIVDGRGREGLCFGDSGGPLLDVDAAGQPVVLGVEHGGEESCVGLDELSRLDKVQDWLDGIAATVPVAQGCGGEGYQGHCEGDTAVWCQDGMLARLDCTLESRTCGLVDDQTGYYCHDVPDCAGVPTGCDGDVRVFCQNGVARAQDCVAAGGYCDEDAGGALCMDMKGQPIAPPAAPAVPTAAPSAPVLPRASHGGGTFSGGCQASASGTVGEGAATLLFLCSAIRWRRQRRRRRHR